MVKLKFVKPSLRCQSELAVIQSKLSMIIMITHIQWLGRMEDLDIVISKMQITSHAHE